MFLFRKVWYLLFLEASCSMIFICFFNVVCIAFHCTCSMEIFKKLRQEKLISIFSFFVFNVGFIVSAVTSWPWLFAVIGGENEKLQSSYVGIFLFICRIKQKGIPGTSKHVISFRWKKGHLSGSSHVANTHSHHFWEGDEAQVSMLPRCAGVVFCAFQVVGFFSDLEKWKRNTKNGHVIHVPVLTKILFFSKWVETTT